MAGAYGMSHAAKPMLKGKSPLKGKKMARGPSDPTPSHKGHASSH